MATTTPIIIAPRQPMVAAETGLISRDWFRFLNNLRTQSGDTTAGLVTAQSSITTLQGQVTALQSQVATLQGQVATLQTDVITLQGQVNDALLLAWLP